MNSETKYFFAVISEKDSALPFLLMSVGKGPEKKIYRPNGLSCHQLLFSLKGSGEAIINGKRLSVPKNSVMYHKPGTLQHYYSTENEWITAWVTFEQKYNVISAPDGVYPADNIPEMTELLEQMLGIEQNILYEEKATVILYRFLLYAAKNMSKRENDNKLLPAIDFIGENFHRDISLEDLSKACGMTREYFCRLFKKTYHTTAFSYIKNIRIQEAKKRLLQNKSEKLVYTADAVGYRSVNYFLTDFKKYVGMTPGEFRAHLG